MVNTMTLQLKSAITRLIEQGHRLYQQHDYQGALRLYYQAWITLPTPQQTQQQAGDILTAIGSSYFHLQRYAPAIEALRSALDIPSMAATPLTLLRLGQCLLDSGQKLQGRTYLQRAYRIGGRSIFKTEKHRYIAAITDLVA